MNIGLIAEGASELRILKNIIGRYIGTNHVLNEIQPTTNDQGTQQCVGGWDQVIKTFENPYTIEEALVENDYVVIQIDTDNCTTKPYSVDNIGTNGQCCSSEELYERVKHRVIDKIPVNENLDKDRVILAICINEIECWLLPIYYNDHNNCKTTNCITLLNSKLVANKIHIITDKNSQTARNTYDKILKKIKKPAKIKTVSQYNFGFEKFIESLDTVVSSNVEVSEDNLNS